MVLRRQLATFLTQRGHRTTFVIDGIDEAEDPSIIIADQIGPLLRLTDDHGRRLVRLIVGLRSSPGPGSEHGLLDLLHRAAHPFDVQQLRTDGEDATADVVAYVEALLTRRDGPYIEQPSAREAAASAIADAVAPSFLDARLAGERLREAELLQDLDDPSWRRSLADGTIGLLRSDIASVATSDTSRGQTLAVLRAVAFADGRGSPWAEIWPAIAEAVADRTIPEVDKIITSVVHGRLSGYLTRDIEHDRIVYRPAHDLLAHALRDRATDLVDPTLAAGVSLESTADVHKRIVTRLAGLTVIDPAHPPHPYIRRYLVRHASYGNVLDDYRVPSAFLPWETSGRIRELLGLPYPLLSTVQRSPHGLVLNPCSPMRILLHVKLV